MSIKTVLVTGPTGYIGGRLIPRLLALGLRVRVLARRPEALEGRPWSAGVEIVKGDIFRGIGLAEALAGVDAAYYLIHSMSDTKDFAITEEISANNFAAAAVRAGVKKIIYLGGLGGDSAGLSHHLRSRRRMGEIFRVKALLPGFQWFFDACTQAGKETVLDGKISPSTQEILDRPLLDLPLQDLVNMTNQYIDKAAQILGRKAGV